MVRGHNHSYVSYIQNHRGAVVVGLRVAHAIIPLVPTASNIISFIGFDKMKIAKRVVISQKENKKKS